MRHYHHYTPEELQFLKDNNEGCSRGELAAKFNRHFGLSLSRGCISCKVRDSGLLAPSNIPYHHHYTPEELQFLKDNNEGCSRGELAAKFNQHFGLSLSRGCISCKVRYSGLLAPSNISYHHHYTPEELQFLKDNNEGCSRGELAAKFNQHFGLSLTTDAIKAIIRFYKIEKKAVYIGTETICKSGYISKKIASGKWRYKHILIWEAANGPVPPGHVVLFLDGDKTNFNLDNLYLLPKRLLGSINRKGLIFRSKDLTTQGIALAQLELLVSDMAGTSRKKKRAEDEQG